MSDIVLSGAIRSNLLALQNTAQLQGTVQNRLATGKKVNSALDNATSFFTSSAFSTRAGQLSALLDSIGNGVQTLKAASTGIESITKLVDNLRATARQALQAPSAYAAKATAVSTASLPAGSSATDLRGSPGPATPGSTTATAALSTLTDGDTLVVDDGAGHSKTMTYKASGANTASGEFGTVADVATILSGVSGMKVSASSAGGNLKLTGADNATTFTVGGTGQAKLGLAGSTAPTPGTTPLDGFNLSFTAGSGAPLTFTFDSTHKSLDDLNSALGTVGLSASLDAGNKLRLTTTSQTESQNFAVGGSGATLAFGSATPTVTPPSRTGTGATSRDAFISQYNGLLAQIDTIAQDATFNGISLLKGDTLSVIFNESNSSKLDIHGVTFDSAGLGLTKLQASDFADGNSITAVMAKLDQSGASLQTQASKFGSNNTVVQTRQEFTKAMMNTLQVGADNLVNADTNEEGANLLALQTRQQLSQSALSLAAQAQQAVLKLFG